MAWRDREYFPKRIGWKWQVWWRYADGKPEIQEYSYEYQHSSLKHWRKMHALREADAAFHAFRAGIWQRTGKWY